ncbi:bifunctional protein FolD 1, mitochondrial-like isoform X2 [Mangifera indica]|uniref:bifunctional protein FolD 1, mitochondrial-like isoform X2 n=1 Tax=Mangifera indica TaxID=29780 RepID=UPI001CFA9F90|nr:bifunctional protein FolD 1, mitochondrial-like isoform X2 [Mangifera indica]
MLLCRYSSTMRGSGGGGVFWQNFKRKWMSSNSVFTSSSSGLRAILGPNLPDVWIPRGSSYNVNTATCPNSFANRQIAAIIDGKLIAQDIKLQIANEIRRMKASIGKSPSLAVVLVGERRDSKTFVRFKLKACDEVGIASSVSKLPQDCSEEELFNVVTGFNENPLIHGIIVQLPLPKHLDEEKILNFVSPEKDVDGFHPLNMGNLAMRGREPLFIPSASKACIELLLRSGVEIIGKKAVVIGRSKITGLPTSLLLQDSSSQKGYRITGDVCFEEAIKVASAITPVPGGIGPVTISMLLSNTLDSAKRAFKFT